MMSVYKSNFMSYQKTFPQQQDRQKLSLELSMGFIMSWFNGTLHGAAEH